MILLKNIRNRHFINLLEIQNHTPTPLNSPIFSEFLFLSPISRRLFSLSALFAAKSDEKIQKRKEPLSSFFKNAIAGSELTNNGGVGAKNSETEKLEEKLRNLEQTVRKLNKERGENGKTPSPVSVQSDSSEQNGAQVNLSAFFTDQKKAKSAKLGYEDMTVHKNLSSDMQMFVHHLYMKGYFKDANFMPKDEFRPTRFEMSYGREFLKFAAVKFGGDHQEIARWLSASDLKKIALFGCPSRGEKPAYAAKHMRKFFGIEEQKVCQKCPLRKPCNLVNKTGNKQQTQLDMAKVMRILIMYAMESVAEQLVVPEEIKASVSRLMKEIIKLSQTTS
ncbi:hypothetical protein PHJA_002866100 [Phtheirospermum japonicum]|uniref:Uncharacterized protein n=1 Tax=Phtheirospermum japonicum TaxID=374723 RepID=A0A830D7J5_9LAMI|nr:hypothetical protein PHJA_002866100 [Phtheirospermum japonicum]